MQSFRFRYVGRRHSSKMWSNFFLKFSHFDWFAIFSSFLSTKASHRAGMWNWIYVCICEAPRIVSIPYLWKSDKRLLSYASVDIGVVAASVNHTISPLYKQWEIYVHFTTYSLFLRLWKKRLKYMPISLYL